MTGAEFVRAQPALARVLAELGKALAAKERDAG